MFRKPKNFFWIFIGIIIFVICFFSRLIPTTEGDAGVFISVGERLLAGDRLYIDVYDNKDPIFYYLVAATRLGGPLAEYFFELGMVVVSSICAYLIALRVSIPKKTAVYSGFIGTPLIITGAFYVPCDTYILPIALSMLTCYLFIRRQYMLAGATIGVLFFTKLIMAPLPIVFCLTYTWIINVPSLRLKNMMFSALGYLLFTVPFLLLLLVREELVPYIHTHILNIQYSQGVLVDNSSLSNLVITHLKTMFLNDNRERILALSTTIGAIFILITLKKGHLILELRAYLYSVIATLIASIFILALTGLWDQHHQLMYFINTLMALYLINSVFQYFPVEPLALVATSLISIFLSGSIDLRTYLANPLEFPGKLNSLRMLSNEAKELIIETNGKSAGYARIGQNDKEGHAFGLQNYKLLCPDFQQYPFYSEERLYNILDCIKGAPFLLVSDSVALWDNIGPEWLPPYSDRKAMIETWNKYVNRVEKVLSENFSCRQINQSDTRVCKKLDLKNDN